MLLLITGPAFGGKTSAAKLITQSASERWAFIEMDAILSNIFLGNINKPGDLLDDAYAVIHASALTLLRAGYSVIVESTFTLIDESGDTQVYDGQIASLSELARSMDVPFQLVQFSLSWETVANRQRQCPRLDADVVHAIWAFHDKVRLPGAHVIDVEDMTSERAAAAILKSRS